MSKEEKIEKIEKIIQNEKERSDSIDFNEFNSKFNKPRSDSLDKYREKEEEKRKNSEKSEENELKSSLVENEKETKEQSFVGGNILLNSNDRIKSLVIGSSNRPLSMDSHLSNQLKITSLEPSPKKRVNMMEEKEFGSNVVLDLVLAIRTCLVSGSKFWGDSYDPSLTSSKHPILVQSNMNGEEIQFSESQSWTPASPSSPTSPASPTNINSSNPSGGNNNSSEGHVGHHDSVQYKISRFGDEKRITVLDYSAKIFAQLRYYFQVTTEDCLHSWGSPEKLELRKSGRSDQIFLYSSDKKFFVKSISKSDSRWLRQMTPHYHEHFLSNPHSILSKTIGHFKIEWKGKKSYFVLCMNVFNGNHVNQVFELKGISANDKSLSEPNSKRQSLQMIDDIQLPKAEESLGNTYIYDVKVDGEEDFALQRGFLNLSEQSYNQLSEALKNDIDWLQSQGVTDYIFLIGIQPSKTEVVAPESPRLSPARPLRNVPSQVFFCEGITTQKATKLRIYRGISSKTLKGQNLEVDTNQKHTESGIFCSNESDRENREYYYLGIIDFWQKYEKGRKTFPYLGKKFDKTALKPEEYAERMKKYISKSVLRNSNETV